VLVSALLPFHQSSAQTSARFPGNKSEIASPNRRWILQSVDRADEPHHSILLKDAAAGKTRKVCDYERSASAVWSPDSRHFALNDYEGSNVAETFIFSVDQTVPRIDLQNEILRSGAPPHGGHEYLAVKRWLDAQRVMVRDWGHTDDTPARDFCVCYVYTLGGSAQKCVQQPKGSNLEERCGGTTP
jgi:hypothetical protein